MSLRCRASLVHVLSVTAAAILLATLPRVRPAHAQKDLSDVRRPAAVVVAPQAPAPDPVLEGAMPGEFVFKHYLDDKYLSFAGGPPVVDRLGPNERVKIVTALGNYRRIVSTDGAKRLVALTGSTTVETRWFPGSVYLAKASKPGPGGESEWWRFSRGTTTYRWTYQMFPKASDTWTAQLFAMSSPRLQLFESSARGFFTVNKCGDLGTNAAYAVRMIGKVDPIWGEKMTLLRQADGTYLAAYRAASSDPVLYVTISGGGGFSSAASAPGGRITTYEKQLRPAWQKLRIVDQGNCTYTLQTPSGFLLGFKGGAASSRLDNPTDAARIGYTALYELIPLDL